MEFRVLGPLELVKDTREITPTAPRLRQVIAFLAVRRNQNVQTGELIREIWGEEPPPSALSTLQTYISKTRRILNGDLAKFTALQTKRHGYLLKIADEEIDLFAYERLAEAGRAALAGGDSQRAADTLAEALALWRGAALHDVPAGLLLHAHVTRLEADRLLTLELRVEADLQLGRHRQLISELKGYTELHPLHEGFHGKLMAALHRSGRRIEAVGLYPRLRAAIMVELGTEPSSELRRQHQSLLAAADEPPDRPSPGREVRLAAPARPGEAVWPADGAPLTADGRIEGGPQVTARLAARGPLAPAQQADRARLVPARPTECGPVVTGRPAECGPLAAAQPAEGGLSRGLRLVAATPAQLPTCPPGFVGREAALALIERRLGAKAPQGAVPIVVITGAPGSGKTALAICAAERVSAAYTAGQLFAELGGSSSSPARPHGVLDGFLRALGVPRAQIPPEPAERSKLFRSWSAGRDLLVLLDDAASADQVAALLPGFEGCAVIVTSRSSGIPFGQAVPLGPLSLGEGIELLARVAGQDRVSAERGAAESIVRSCDRLPLAIHAAGVRLATEPGRPLWHLARRLAEVTHRLAELEVDGFSVQTALHASFGALGEHEHAVARALSAVPGGAFTSAEAAALLGCGVGTADAVLARLVAGHVLEVARDDGDGPARYAFLALAHAHAHALASQPPGLALATGTDA